MIESHIVGGRQELVLGNTLNYGQSITDACIDWDTSVAMLEQLAQAVRVRQTLPTTTTANKTSKTQ